MNTHTHTARALYHKHRGDRPTDNLAISPLSSTPPVLSTRPRPRTLARSRAPNPASPHPKRNHVARTRKAPLPPQPLLQPQLRPLHFPIPGLHRALRDGRRLCRRVRAVRSCGEAERCEGGAEGGDVAAEVALGVEKRVVRLLFGEVERAERVCWGGCGMRVGWVGRAGR